MRSRTDPPVSMLGGPHELLLFPEVLGTDSDGNRVRKPGVMAVTVRGVMQPLTAAESQVSGQEFATSYKFLCPAFPAGAWARVEWDGRSWDVQGEPQRVGVSPATRHVRVILRARDPRVLP